MALCYIAGLNIILVLCYICDIDSKTPCKHVVIMNMLKISFL